MPTDPIVEPDRPHMPGYGITAADSREGLLPWSWAAERLTAAHNYWLATTHPSGAPHLTAVWGVWMNDAFYFSCATSSRKALNLAAEPRCVVCPERGEEAVIVEGVAEVVTAASTLGQFKEAYDPKYDWDIKIDAGGIYVVRPRVVFGFIENPDQFSSTATRWRFRDD